jgi:hypothetical protein
MLNLRVLTPVLCVLFNLSAPVEAEPIKGLADLSILRASERTILLPDENYSISTVQLNDHSVRGPADTASTASVDTPVTVDDETPRIAEIVCSMIFADGTHLKQTGFIGNLTTADGEIPRVSLLDPKGYVEIKAVSVNYMGLLLLTVILPHQNVEEFVQINLPTSSEHIFQNTYKGDFGTRRTWTPGRLDVDFQANKLDISCSYLL